MRFIWFLLIPCLCFSQMKKGGYTGFSEKWGMWKEATSYNDSADVLFGRMTVNPPPPLKDAISQFYDTIQAYNVDDSLDFLFNFAVHTTQAAVLDWANIANTATLVNSPTFTAYQGYLTDGASSYIKVNYNPGTDSVHYLINSASIGIYIRTNNIVNAKYLIGIYDGSIFSYIRLSTTNIVNDINSASASTYSHSSDISGFTCLTRQNATTLAYSRNGATYTTKSNNSVSTVNDSDGLYLGAANFQGVAVNFSNNQFSFAFGGGQLTETQKDKLYEAMERYMDAYGYGVND